MPLALLVEWLTYISKEEDKSMRNEYTAPEVIEIGGAQEVILGSKEGLPADIDQVQPALDLDE